MGSDGLFDNIFVTEILQIINDNVKNIHDFSKISEKLANLAISRGKDTKF